MPTGIWTNCIGTSKRQKRCKVCGPWRSHWEQKSGKTFPKKCKIKGCGNKADLGAHIRNLSTKKSNKQYIIPACYGCNKRGTKKSPVEFQLQKQIVSAVQCHVKALRVSKKTTSKKALKKSFNPPGQNSIPPEGWKLKSGYRCKKVNGRRKYWTPTGRSSAQRNACTQSKKASKKAAKNKAKLGTKLNPYHTKAAAEKGKKKETVWYYYHGNRKNLKSMQKK